jgi:hypothetical protein
MLSGSLLFALFVFIVVVILIIRTIRVVPQQRAWVLERLGRFHSVLQPGLNFVVPFLDRVAYKHDLREIPLDVPQPDLHHQGQHAAAGRRHPVFPGDRPAARLVRLSNFDARDHAARADHAAQRDRPHGARPHVRGARHINGRWSRARRGARTGASRCCATRSRT